jgi:hypothetical protein
MKPQHLYDQTLPTLVSLKFYADTSAFGLNNLQPVQVYYASMSYDFFFQERGKCFDSAQQPCFDSAQQPYFDSAQQPYFDMLSNLTSTPYFDISPLASTLLLDFYPNDITLKFDC